jgi:hypothetical protein
VVRLYSGTCHRQLVAQIVRIGGIFYGDSFDSLGPEADLFVIFLVNLKQIDVANQLKWSQEDSRVEDSAVGCFDGANSELTN